MADEPDARARAGLSHSALGANREPRPEAAAVVLAAGKASRFGATKPLAHLRGCPLIRYAIDAARAAGIEHIVVVLGHDADNVAAEVGDDAALRIAMNPEYAHGQASSVRVGLEALRAELEIQVAVVLLADQPGIDPLAIRRVLDVIEDGKDAARVRYQDKAGHPVALHRRVWDRVLAGIEGDAGARTVLEDLDVVHVQVDGPSPPDIDKPEDLASMEPGGCADPRFSRGP